MAQTGVTRTRVPTGTESGAIAPTAAAGAISMTQPPQLAAPSFYKIFPNNPVTFGWNYSYLSVQPKTLFISAYCDQYKVTYPVGNPEGTLAGAPTQVVWDLYAAEQQPGARKFAEAEYTLRIHDERGDGVQARGGYLSPYSGLKFGIYSAKPAVPLESESPWRLSSAKC